MNLEKLKEPFPEDQIEWRISRAGKSQGGKIWAKCLAYISARDIQDRLDEVCGPENWRVGYRMEAAGVICMLSIKIGPEWITKEDGAEQSDIEAFKGGISGALKRAGAAWGIGRFLYNLTEGFAEIVDSGADGARYAQTKELGTFYWVPPRLPAWAVPKAESKPIAAPLAANPVLGKPFPPKKVVKPVEAKMRIMPKSDEPPATESGDPGPWGA